MGKGRVEKGETMTTKNASKTSKIGAGGFVNFAEPKDNVDSGDDYCVQCGRKVGKSSWWVEIIEGGEIRQQDGTEYDTAKDAGYMGCWAVGSECAKLFESNVLIKRERREKS